MMNDESDDACVIQLCGLQLHMALSAAEGGQEETAAPAVMAQKERERNLGLLA